MSEIKILWADDEIELLKPHIIFLKEKGYDVQVTKSGDETLDQIKTELFDVVFLDENMPGLSGLETLTEIKKMQPSLPVVMITKNEQEHTMEEALGSSIADYLIKPVNPHQILLSLKKIFENKELISQKTISEYQQEFREISMAINDRPDFNAIVDIYKRIVRWELDLEKSDNNSMAEVLTMQKHEMNNVFADYIEKNYLRWLTSDNEDKPTLSHTLFREKVAPLLAKNDPVFVIVVDNFRYDQWKAVQPILEEYFRVEEDAVFCSILPTATQYARNAFFSGLLPAEIEKIYPNLWLNEDEEGSKNDYEEDLLKMQLKRLGKDVKFKYTKIIGLDQAKKYVDNLSNLMDNKLNILVYNFVDMLSHARTEMNMIKELASDEKAYRSLTVSWFKNSPLFEVLQFLAEKKVSVVITTDHGSVKVTNPVKVVGERNTNKNLRYKIGRNLGYEKRDVMEIKKPAEAHLPKIHVSSAYVFCTQYDFFVYPNNQNHYAQYYMDTFQHGGVSAEEMLIPYIHLKAK